MQNLMFGSWQEICTPCRDRCISAGKRQETAQHQNWTNMNWTWPICTDFEEWIGHLQALPKGFHPGRTVCPSWNSVWIPSKPLTSAWGRRTELGQKVPSGDSDTTLWEQSTPPALIGFIIVRRIPKDIVMRGKRGKGFSGDHLHWHRFEGRVTKPFIETARTMLSNAWMKCSLIRPDYARHGKTQVCYAWSCLVCRGKHHCLCHSRGF